MASNWQDCKNILCIRPDNMGDLIMTGPALRALKESLGCKITVLTSSMAASVAKLMPEIDEVIIFDVPWVKNHLASDPKVFNETVKKIAEKQFDAAVVFTVYSQNPLPTVMLAYLAGIPKRLAYCRENPYQLLTDWVPDQEPYTLIKHQVRRDLDLVANIGAVTRDDKLKLKAPDNLKDEINHTLTDLGIELHRPWLIFHPGVSEVKREYPVEQWAEAGRQLISKGYQVAITGAGAERELCEQISQRIGEGSFNSAGLFNLDAFVALISMAPVVVSVNTGTIHVAAAAITPVVVLYALTNPQHTPWKVHCKVLPFQVAESAQSKNEVIRHVNHFLYSEPVNTPDAIAVACAVEELLSTEPAVSFADAIISLPVHRPFQNQAD
jgi:lipopolysaccharide heptosyltransferase II